MHNIQVWLVYFWRPASKPIAISLDLIPLIKHNTFAYQTVGFLQDSPPASTAYNTMRTIYSMGKGKYITLDSYGETHENRLGNVLVATFAIIIAVFTVPALLGVDITNINPQPNNEAVRSTNR
jgi:hypothetical protein